MLRTGISHGSQYIPPVFLSIFLAILSSAGERSPGTALGEILVQLEGLPHPSRPDIRITPIAVKAVSEFEYWVLEQGSLVTFAGACLWSCANPFTRGHEGKLPVHSLGVLWLKPVLMGPDPPSSFPFDLDKVLHWLSWLS